MLQSMIDEQLAGRAWLASSLDGAGYRSRGSEGNFMFIKPFGDASEVVRRMKSEKGILIKEYGGIGEFGSCLRVTTGPKPAMERFFGALCEIDGGSANA